MSLNQRIDNLVQLGKQIDPSNEKLQSAVTQARLYNAWFTEENTWKSLMAIKTSFLQKEILEKWASQYDIPEGENEALNPRKKIGLVLAGNIPLVGWHDIMCCYVSGHIAMIKLSDKDRFLIPCLLDLLSEIDPNSSTYFMIVEQLKGFDAVIATGSNNTSKYFEYYFGKYPHIIRANRNAIAILTGEESEDEIKRLGADIFEYFGLGCRNVSSCLVPLDFEWNRYLEIWHEEYKLLAQHNKYKNNFDHNVSLFILNKQKYLINGCLLVKEDKSIASRIASLYYQTYEDLQSAVAYIKDNKEKIQCVVTDTAFDEIDTVPFGKAQQPDIDDYADGVDTMQFLTQL